MNKYDFNFFVFKDVGYGYNTIVQISEKYRKTHKYDDRKICKYAYFRGVLPGSKKYKFEKAIHKWGDKDLEYAWNFMIDADDMEEAIEEIVKANVVELVDVEPLKDSESPEVLVGWCVYVFALFFSLIFQQWYIVWTMGSALFFFWRYVKLREWM